VEDAGLDLPVEAVHHRQHDDQRHHPEGHGAEGKPGDYREKAFALLATHIAKTDEKGQWVDHRRHLTEKAGMPQADRAGGPGTPTAARLRAFSHWRHSRERFWGRPQRACRLRAFRPPPPRRTWR